MHWEMNPTARSWRWAGCPREEAAEQHAGKDVPCAGVAARQPPAEHPPVPPGGALVGGDADLVGAGLVDGAGDEHRIRPEVGQGPQPGLEGSGSGDRGGRVLAEQQGGLGLVRDDEVRLADEAAHLGDHSLFNGGVEGAVVPHHRVHDHPGVRRAEGADDLPDQLHLGR